MDIQIEIPAVLRSHCEGHSELSLSAETPRAALASIESLFPELYAHLCDDSGDLQSHIQLVIGSKLVRDSRGLDTPLHPGQTIGIFQAVAGG